MLSLERSEYVEHEKKPKKRQTLNHKIQLFLFQYVSFNNVAPIQATQHATYKS